MNTFFLSEKEREKMQGSDNRQEDREVTKLEKKFV